MGHREDLLEGAKQCLQERGYAHTTARDLVAASNTNLASIGYHYGSKEALLNAALVAVFRDWGDEMDRILSSDTESCTTPMQRLRVWLPKLVESFTTMRPMWIATMEAFPIAERTPELHAQLAAGQREGRRGLAASLYGVAEDSITEQQSRHGGALFITLLNGLMMQWLLDPENAPSAEDTITALGELPGVGDE